MTFPTNGVFPIEGCKKPGEASVSKPKKAMIMRMTEEIFNALSTPTGQPAIQIQFGETNGIFVGDTFFPISQTTDENHPHEIYLRSSVVGQTKTSAFKHHANVVGKFSLAVSNADKVGEKVRERKKEAEIERATIVQLTEPPVTKPTKPATKPKVAKKKDGMTMFHNPVPSGSGSSSTSRTPAPAPTLAPDIMNGLRFRAIHCIAPGDRTETEVLQSVARNNPPQQAYLSGLLKEIAEPAAKSGKLQLKTKIWTDLRPLTFQPYSQTVRESLCVEASKRFKALGIPEGDPRWDHITPSANRSPPLKKRPSPVAPTVSSTTSGRGTAAPERETSGVKVSRRFLSQEEIREKQAAAASKSTSSRLDPRDERRPGSALPKQRDFSPAVPNSSSSNRKPQPDLTTKSSQKYEKSSSSGSTRRDAVPANSRDGREHSSSQRPSQRTKTRDDDSVCDDSDADRRVKQRAARNKDPIARLTRAEREEGEYSDSSIARKRKAASERESDRESRHSPSPSKRRKMDIPSSSGLPSKPKLKVEPDCGRERERERERERDRGRERDRDLRLPARPVDVAQPSRNKALRDERSPVPSLSRKRDRERSPTGSVRESKRDYPSETKASKRRSPPPPAPKAIKREPSPTGSIRDRKRGLSPSASSSRGRGNSPLPKRPTERPAERTRPSVQQQSKSYERGDSKSSKASSSKPRRKSPIYTSSEDEEEPAKPAVTAKPRVQTTTALSFSKNRTTTTGKPSADLPKENNTTHATKAVPSTRPAASTAAVNGNGAATAITSATKSDAPAAKRQRLNSGTPKEEYDDKIIEYDICQSRLKQERRRLEKAVRRMNESGLDEISVSEGELLSSDAFEQLTGNEAAQRAELKRLIHDHGRSRSDVTVSSD